MLVFVPFPFDVFLLGSPIPLPTAPQWASRPPPPPRELPPAALGALYLPSPVHIGRVLDVVEIQNQSSQGGAQPAEPQQDHHCHPLIASLRPPNWAAPTPQESKTETPQGRLELLFSKGKQIFVSVRCVNSEWAGSFWNYLYQMCLLISLSPTPLHFLPPYPTQASTNPFKSVWSIVQNKDSREREKGQGLGGFSFRGWIPLNYCISKLVQRVSRRAGCLYQRRTLLITCISYLQ